MERVLSGLEMKIQRQTSFTIIEHSLDRTEEAGIDLLCPPYLGIIE